MGNLWADGGAYERYMGRWSRRIAPQFVEWLDLRGGLRWADLGCGTGALSTSVLELAAPASVVGVDPSPGFLEEAAASLVDPRVTLRHGSVEQLEPGAFDAVVAGLVLNFVPDVEGALRAMADAASGGTVAAYVWDYAGGMEMLHRFWSAAERLAPVPVGQQELSRFAMCEPGELTRLWEGAGMSEVTTVGLGTEAAFGSFEEIWAPFLGGTGPAPAYVQGLDEAQVARLRDELERDLRRDEKGGYRLGARAWAVRGTAPS